MSSLVLKNKLHNKNAVGGPMHREEIKMNRALLNDINSMKKKLGDRFSSPGASASKQGGLVLN